VVVEEWSGVGVSVGLCGSRMDIASNKDAFDWSLREVAEALDGGLSGVGVKQLCKVCSSSLDFMRQDGECFDLLWVDTPEVDFVTHGVLHIGKPRACGVALCEAGFVVRQSVLWDGEELVMHSPVPTGVPLLCRKCMTVAVERGEVLGLDLRRFVSARGFYARDAVVTAMEEDSRPMKEEKVSDPVGRVVDDSVKTLKSTRRSAKEKDSGASIPQKSLRDRISADPSIIYEDKLFRRYIVVFDMVHRDASKLSAPPQERADAVGEWISGMFKDLLVLPKVYADVGGLLSAYAEGRGPFAKYGDLRDVLEAELEPGEVTDIRFFKVKDGTDFVHACTKIGWSLCGSFRYQVGQDISVFGAVEVTCPRCLDARNKRALLPPVTASTSRDDVYGWEVDNYGHAQSVRRMLVPVAFSVEGGLVHLRGEGQKALCGARFNPEFSKARGEVEVTCGKCIDFQIEQSAKVGKVAVRSDGTTAVTGQGSLPVPVGEGAEGSGCV